MSLLKKLVTSASYRNAAFKSAPMRCINVRSLAVASSSSSFGCNIAGNNSTPYKAYNLSTSQSFGSRTFGTTTENEETKQEENNDQNLNDESATGVEEQATDGESESEEPEQSREEELQVEVTKLKDQLLRSLAEQENIRRIAKKDVQSSKNYAVSSFAKSLLDTHDNLQRAMEAVPEELRDDHENHKTLANLYEGIKMTDDNFTKAFKKNNLIKYGAVDDKFDPNLHNALFEYADDTKEAGTVGQVMKSGFMLNKRVIRPADVGTIKK
mmetsp:Transcript_48464/g.48809  ORF Transcript_48464/g.48809 Transcript_48464/m.48809 type:complete len:269 (-) Transcript_48464:49-855(-)